MVTDEILCSLWIQRMHLDQDQIKNLSIYSQILCKGRPQKEKTGYFMTSSKIHLTPTHLTKL